VRANLGDEPVTAAMDRLDIHRLQAVVAEGLAQQTDYLEQ
jgi:hypothetical protein